MPFKKTSFFPLYVEYLDEIFNPHPHIPHMRIIRIFRIFRIRMANPSVCGYGAGWLSQLGATAQAGVVGPCLGCRLPIFETSLYLISPGLEAKVRAVGSLKPWTANVKVFRG